MAPRTLAFVIGAQRSGTTWLHDYLSGHPQVSTGLAKEGNYFAHQFLAADDPRYSPDRPSRRRPVWLRRWRAADAVLAVGGRRRFDAVSPAALSGDFVRFFGRGAGDAAVLADVSSYHSLLDGTALATMARAHPDTRFVLILRDPVERAWSELKWRLGRKTMGSAKFAAAVQAAMGDPRWQARWDYERMLTTLTDTVPRDRFHVAFTETLFSDAGLHHLCGFLGIGFQAGDYARAVNSGPRAEVPQEWEAQLRPLLDGSYAGVRARLANKVPPAWRA